MKGATPVNTNSFYDRKSRLAADEQERSEARAQREKEAKAEADRVAGLSCPACKGRAKWPMHLSVQNGPIVYGGRNSRTTLADYMVCKRCGCMYVDIVKFKKDNKDE